MIYIEPEMEIIEFGKVRTTIVEESNFDNQNPDEEPGVDLGW